MSETAMWLIPVALAAVAGIVISIRMGLRWTWGMLAQQLLIAVVALVGVYFVYGPALPGVPSWFGAKAANYCVWLSWLMFLGFNFGQRMILNRFVLDVSLMRLQDARKSLPVLKMFVWGPPSECWTDLVNALWLYHEGDTAAGDAVFEKWRNDTRIPAVNKESILGLAMLGRVMHDDWDGIIDAFHASHDRHSANPPVPLQMVARAFAEKHLFTESLACLQLLKSQSGRSTASNVDLAFVPFFALSGASAQLQGLFDRCADKKSLPDYSRLFWMGRCRAASGNFNGALQLLAQAQSAIPTGMQIWHERVKKQIDAIQLVAAGLQAASIEQPTPQILREAERTYGSWRVCADILRPARSGPAMMILIIAIVVAYIAAHPFDILKFVIHINESNKDLFIRAAHWQRDALLQGQLDGHLWTGEWWRSITYMFLHGNTPHMLLNVGALFIFGKTVENMYGSWRFLIIFFLSGILSGMLQLWAIPQDAAVGASGAILGIFGAGIAGLIKLKNVLPNDLRQSELQFMLKVAVAQVIFDQLANSFAAATDKSNTGNRIAAFAHLGGILAGFVIGMILPLRKFPLLDSIDTAAPNS
jgi:membrane associated rhomboid family serine protease